MPFLAPSRPVLVSIRAPSHSPHSESQTLTKETRTLHRPLPLPLERLLRPREHLRELALHPRAPHALLFVARRARAMSRVARRPARLQAVADLLDRGSEALELLGDGCGCGRRREGAGRWVRVRTGAEVRVVVESERLDLT